MQGRVHKMQCLISRIYGQGGGERGKLEYFGGGVLTSGTVSGIMAYKARGGMRYTVYKTDSQVNAMGKTLTF